MVKIFLTTNGFKNVKFSDCQNAFTFIVNGKSFSCPRIIADFLSPKVAQMHYTDITSSNLIINTKSKIGNFEHVLNLAYGGEIEVNEINQNFLEEISTQLENEEIFLLLIPPIKHKESEESIINCDQKENNINNANELKDNKFKNKDECDKTQLNNENPLSPDEDDYKSDYDELFSRIKKKREFSSGKRPISIEDEVDFLASFFYEIFVLDKIKEKLNYIDYSILYEVLMNDKLVLKNEGQLATLIMTLAEELKDDSFYSLFEFVQFENLTLDEMTHFVTHFDVNFLNKNIWEKLAIRLRSEILTPQIKDVKRYKSISFNYDINDDKNEGIIHYLNNVLKKSESEVLINLTSSSGNPKNILLNQEFSSYNIPNSWILIDLISYQVCLKSYSIKCYSTVPYNMRQWVIEGSNNLLEWVELDSRNTYDLNQARAVKNFVCANKNILFFRYIRTRHIGFNGANTAQMFIGGIELYGDVLSN